MTQTPGWYPEPDPTYSGPPGRLRYWDGQRWTEHVHEAAPVVPSPQAPPPRYPDYAQAPPQQYPQTQYPQPQYPQAQYPQYQQPSYGYQAPVAPVPSTPDGAPLASWWARALAAILDFLISIPLYALAAAPFVAAQWDEISDWFSAQMDAAETGTSTSQPFPDIFDPTTASGIGLALATLVVSVAYAVIFLRWKQATPGKLILGLRVRLREQPGLPWGAILLRVGFVAGIGILRDVPILGILAVLLAVLDYLWAAWDGKKQTLHDKVARTNVVKLR